MQPASLDIIQSMIEAPSGLDWVRIRLCHRYADRQLLIADSLNSMSWMATCKISSQASWINSGDLILILRRPITNCFSILFRKSRGRDHSSLEVE